MSFSNNTPEDIAAARAESSAQAFASKNEVNRETRKTVVNILVGVVIGLASRYLVDYVYDTMRRGGLTPTTPFVHADSDGRLRQSDVYLIPFAGFSEQAASQFANGLSRELGIVVKATGAMPLPSGAKDADRDQFIADRLYPSLRKFCSTLRDTTAQTAYIGIIADDMYPEGSTWNYCFALNFGDRVSVVATDRLLPHGVLSRKEAGRIYGERLYKLLKRTIGLQYFGYERSSDPRSVLFSPLMGLDALDRMTPDYRIREQPDGAVTQESAPSAAP